MKNYYLLDDTTNQPSKFRTRNWVEINDESRGVYNNNNNENNNNNINFKMTMIMTNLCDYSDAYILVKETLTVLNTAAQGAAINNDNKNVIFKNCAPFTNWITEINNAQVDDAQDDDYTAGCLLDYPYFKKYYKLIAINLSKQKNLGADPNAIHQVNFIGNLSRAEGATMFFITEEAKEIILDFSKGTVKAM